MTTYLQRWQIRVTGVVQGVGFRPFVYALAQRFALNGWVLNDADGVLIELDAQESTLHDFVAQIKTSAPPLSQIHEIHIHAQGVAQPLHSAFAIRHSQIGGDPSVVVATDSHVCADCLREMRDPEDRRYQYPFINCTHCGPRFSIIKSLPYDRASTTMDAFAMCSDCLTEYQNPLSRRYHAQPIACPKCGPKLELIARDGARVYGTDALTQANAALNNGQIVAVKSIGGFHLAVNARDEAAVARLRARKRRDAKPFAVMARDIETVKQWAQLSELERGYLESPARPIVLLKKRSEQNGLDILAPHNPSIGMMLPSAPLHYLLLDELGVLVMTSGNVSGQPIEFTNEGAIARLFDVADVILANNRDIHMRIDDSVIRVTEHASLPEPLITYIRKARGYAPYPIDIGLCSQTDASSQIIALGAELKTTIALSKHDRVYISQHIGDLKNHDTRVSHQLIAEHLANLYQLQPRITVGDMHPSFNATEYSRFASSTHMQQVQHHHAHMAACMADNGLSGQSGKTLGVIFDGAGFGADGTIWGGEFLYGDCAQAVRAAHLCHIPLIGGDAAVYEPVRTAFALVKNSDGAHLAQHCDSIASLRTLSATQRNVFAHMMDKQLNTFLASSVGRLFDGVAALLGICTHAEYEAQGPIELEGLLQRDLTMVAGYEFGFDLFAHIPTIIDYAPVIRAIIEDIQAHIPIATISRKFHSGMVQMVVRVCQDLHRHYPFNQVVLSGGVFLNEFLCVNTLIALRQAGIAAYAHKNVPSNDGGISLGQVMVARAHQVL